MAKIKPFILPVAASVVWFFLSYYELRNTIKFFPILLGVLICSILVGGIIWYLQKIVNKDYEIKDLLIGSICAIIAPILWMTMSGPGQTYYYKVIYPIGELEVRQAAGGSFCLGTATVGIGVLIYAGWLKAKEKGWKGFNYFLVICGIVIAFVAIFAIVTAIQLSNM